MKHDKLPEEIARRIPQAVFDALQDNESVQQALIDMARQAVEEAERLRNVMAEALVIQEREREGLETIISPGFFEEESENLRLEPVGAGLVDESVEIERPLPTTRVRSDGEFHKIQHILKYAERWSMMADEQDFDSLMQRIRPKIFELTERRMREEYSSGMRISHSVDIMFKRWNAEAQKFEYRVRDPRSKPMKVLHILFHHNNFNDLVWDVLRNTIEKFTNAGSGWILHRIIRFDVHLNVHKQYVGASYLRLPLWVSLKKAVVNIKNKDQLCFKWAMLAALHPQTHHPDRVTPYKKHELLYDWSGLDFPLHLNDIDIFEKNNPGIKVNVFSIARKTSSNKKSEHIIHLRQATDQSQNQVQTGKVVNLLLIWPEGAVDDEEVFGKAHFCWIKDLSRLTAASRSNKNANFICTNCCNGFMTPEKLQSHFEVCCGFKAQQLVYPMLDKKTARPPVLKFKPYGKEYNRYIVIADLEADIVEIRMNQRDRMEEVRRITQGDNAATKSATYRHSIHKVNSYEFVIVDCENPDEMPVVVTNTTTVQEEIIPEMLSRLQEYAFNLTPKGKKLNVFFHNLRGYDSHHILQHIENFSKISCIPDNMERYKCVTVDQVAFKDSLQFLDASLDKLVKNLPREKFKITQKFFEGRKLELVMRKGVYPYKWKTNREQFRATKLPPIEAFHNDLTDTPCSKKDYLFAKLVWKTFEMKTFQDYHDLYLKTDVLLLADVFREFRETAIGEYKLDPTNYISLPSYAFDAMLKVTKVKIELLTDPDMYLFFEKGLRGGITTAITRYAKANNPQCPKYDPGKKTSFIVYVDKNNLYGYAMCLKLPHSGYKWVSEKDLEKFNTESLKTFDFNGDTGYALEIDAYVPKELHDKHSDFPLAPEHRAVPLEDLSPYTASLAEELGIDPGKNKKLMCTLHPKEKYVVHGLTLQKYVNAGLVVTKVHRAVEFHQKAWLQPYIERNTAKRALATTDFDKDFYKLMNNAVFGKTMENVRLRVNVQLAGGDELGRILGKPNVEQVNIISSNLAAVRLKKTSVMMDKPIPVGFAILDLSKCEMYDYHYNYMLERYPGSRATLLYTDTDSFIYLVETEDLYADMKEDSHLFDFSGYSKDHQCFSNENKKVVGKMKDELNGIFAVEFVSLKAKMYALSLLRKKDNQMRKAKGVSRSYVKQKLTLNLYKKTLFERLRTRAETSKIQSKCHQLYTQTQTKIALSPYDDKRYVLDDGIHTLAHGHFRIEEWKNLHAPQITKQESRDEECPPYSLHRGEESQS